MPRWKSIARADRTHPVGALPLARACPACAARFEVQQSDGLFFARCEHCGLASPPAASAYEAMMAWREMFGKPAPSMLRMTLMVSFWLLIVAAMLGLLALIAG